MGADGTHPNRRSAASLPPELRRAPVPEAARTWVGEVTGSPVLRVRRLPGASTSAVHRLDLADGRRVVLRRYAWPGFLAAEPAGPVRERDALRLASASGLGPRLLAADPDGSAVGDGVPGTLMARLPGRAVTRPDLSSLAAAAAAVHDVDARAFPHDWFPWYLTDPRPPATSLRPARWEAAIDVWIHGRPAFTPGFVHRDLHPGNVLWSRGRCTGLVDWVNSCRGPWECDVGHCRTNLLELGGDDAADRFLDHYLALTGRTYDPYWEIASVMEHDPAWWTPSRLAGAETRLDRALRSR